jgi:hypothetical protein
MFYDTRKGVVYGTRLSEDGFAIANPYQSQVLRLFFGTSTGKRTGIFFNSLPIFTFEQIDKEKKKNHSAYAFNKSVTVFSAPRL